MIDVFLLVLSFKCFFSSFFLGGEGSAIGKGDGHFLCLCMICVFLMYVPVFCWLDVYDGICRYPY